MNYAHRCCGVEPVYRFNRYHVWEGIPQGGTYYYCPTCHKVAPVIGPQLFALKCWNELIPAHAGVDYVTCVLRWEWLIMGGREKGELMLVVSQAGKLIHPLTGTAIEWPHEVQEYSTPKGRYYISLCPWRKREQKELLKRLSVLTGEAVPEELK